MKAGTAVYQRQHKAGLTMPQLNAIDLLATGKTDKETAELAGLSRTCITKWRLYDVTFAAELNRRRADVWASGIDKLRALIPKALDALADELDRPGANRLKAADAILRLVQLPAASAIGATDPEEIVRQVTLARRERTAGPLDSLMDAGKGLLPLDEHMDEVRRELDTLAKEDCDSRT